MSSGAVLAVVVVGLVVLGALLAFATARRRDERQALATSVDDSREESTALVAADHAPVSGRELERSVALEQRGRGVAPAEGPTPVPFTPPDEETLGITRRQVLNRGIVSTMGLAVTGFGASMLAMLWPSLSGGFGAKIRAGKVDEILEEIADKKEPFYLASGRFYINPYPKEAVAAAKGVPEYSAVLPGYEAGFVALYQKCVHLGCRVPWCTTSQWFECPCHGSQYNRVGEKKGGPAPRGLDRFALSIEGGNVMVDTGEIIDGPPIGTDTTGQEAEGPNCIGAVSSH